MRVMSSCRWLLQALSGRKQRLILRTLAVFFCAGVFLAGKTALAATQEVEGTVCWEGNLNYPVWDFGPHGVILWDVSSAYLIEADGAHVVVGVNSIGMPEGSDSPHGVMFMKVEERGKEIIDLTEGRNFVLTAPMRGAQNIKAVNDAFYLIKAYLNLL